MLNLIYCLKLKDEHAHRIHSYRLSKIKEVLSYLYLPPISSIFDFLLPCVSLVSYTPLLGISSSFTNSKHQL